MNDCTHSWVAGMMVVHPEDLYEISRMRTVECQHCDVTVDASADYDRIDRLSAWSE
jgi:hypothetical protein